MRTLTQKAAMVFGVVFLLVGILGLFGAWGIAASRSYGGSRAYHRTGAVIYLVLVVLAFIDATTFGLVPIGDNDIWLHAILAIGLGYFGFIHREVGVPDNS